MLPAPQSPPALALRFIFTSTPHSSSVHIFMIGMHRPSRQRLHFAFRIYLAVMPSGRWPHTYSQLPIKLPMSRAKNNWQADSSSLIKSQARPNSQATQHFPQLHAKLRWRCFTWSVCGRVCVCVCVSVANSCDAAKKASSAGKQHFII